MHGAVIGADLHSGHPAAWQMGRDLTKSTGVQISDPGNVADGCGDPVGQVIGSWCRRARCQAHPRRDLVHRWLAHWTREPFSSTWSL